MEQRTLTISSEIEHIPEARSFVEAAARDMGCAERDIFDLKVAVGEACANAIEHGSPQGRESRIEITVCPDGEALRVDVRDEGVFRDKLGSIESQALKGRGLFLMLALVDRMAVERSPNGTTVRLWKECRSGSKELFRKRGRLPRNEGVPEEG